MHLLTHFKNKKIMFDLKTFVTVLVVFVVWRILDKNVLPGTPLASFEAESLDEPQA